MINRLWEQWASSGCFSARIETRAVSREELCVLDHREGLSEESCEMMATRKKILVAMRPALFVVVGSGIFVLAGCISPPLVQEGADQPASVPTPFASSIPAPIKETETVTVVPTGVIPMPTAMPSLAHADASTIFEEPFIDNRNNWHTDSTLITIAAGKYNHKIDCPNSNVSPHCGTFIKMPFIFPRNFRLEIDATIIESSTGAGVMVAFEVRRNAEYYYVNYFITDGRYQISRISEFGIFRIIPETSTDFIMTAVGDTNKLGIEMKDTSLTPLLNGHELAPAFDGKIPAAGDSYLVILVARGHSAELQFDNLVVQEVK